MQSPSSADEEKFWLIACRNKGPLPLSLCSRVRRARFHRDIGDDGSAGGAGGRREDRDGAALVERADVDADAPVCVACMERVTDQLCWPQHLDAYGGAGDGLTVRVANLDDEGGGEG